MITPISVEILAYGRTANLSKIRTAGLAQVEEEHGAANPAELVEDLPAEAVAGAIQSRLWDGSLTLLKVTPALEGMRLQLPSLHARFAGEFLHELQVAKSCVALASWQDADEDHQILYLQGERWADSRPRQA